MERSEAAFLKQLKQFGPQVVDAAIGNARERINALALRSLVTVDIDRIVANRLTVTITDAGRAALEEHIAQEKVERERLTAALTAPKPAPTPPAPPVEKPHPAPAPAAVTTQVMTEAGYEPCPEPGQYRSHRERPSMAGGIPGAPRIAVAAAFESALIEFARSARRRGLDVETDGRMDRTKIARAANQVLRGVASDRPEMTTERLCEALGKLVETTAAGEGRKAA